MIKEIIKAIVLLLVVSSSIAGSFSLFFNWSINKFFVATAIATVLQIAIKWYIDQYKESSIEIISSQLPPPTIKMKIECAFCRSENIIDYDVTREEFQCTQCENVNSIYGKFYAARKATPIDTVLSAGDAQ